MSCVVQELKVRKATLVMRLVEKRIGDANFKKVLEAQISYPNLAQIPVRGQCIHRGAWFGWLTEVSDANFKKVPQHCPTDFHRMQRSCLVFVNLTMMTFLPLLPRWTVDGGGGR